VLNSTATVVGLITPPPAPQQVTDQLTFNWHQLNVCDGLGQKWYTHVVLWWGLFVAIITALIVYFSGPFL
jgi:SSS family solute:Na+ symporter